MKQHPSGTLPLVLLAGITLTAGDSNSDDDNGPHNHVAYVEISAGGISYYAASQATPISPIMVARNAVYGASVDFDGEGGIPIEHAAYTQQVFIYDCDATWATVFRNTFVLRICSRGRTR